MHSFIIELENIIECERQILLPEKPSKTHEAVLNVGGALMLLRFGMQDIAIFLLHFQSIKSKLYQVPKCFRAKRQDSESKLRIRTAKARANELLLKIIEKIKNILESNDREAVFRAECLV